MLKRTYILPLLLVFLFLLAFLPEVAAQCPMCKASAEASLKEGQTTALGLNEGILYLLAFPYLMVAMLAGIWYFRYYKRQQAPTA